MAKGRCWHLPAVVCDCVNTGQWNSEEEAGGSDGCQALYVIQVTAIDGQLHLSVPLSPQSDGPICRICHGEGSTESLLSPCNCKGTLGSVHKSCLEDWLSSSNSSYCELCHTEFSIELRPRSFTEWLRDPGPRIERRRVFCDIICFLFFTASSAILGWLGLSWALEQIRLGDRAFGGFLIACAFGLFIIYVMWTLVSFFYNWQLYSKWRRRNMKVCLLIPEAKESNSSQHC